MNATDEKHTKCWSEIHRVKDHMEDPASEGSITYLKEKGYEGINQIQLFGTGASS
jgi:hypothetical protein